MNELKDHDKAAQAYEKSSSAFHEKCLAYRQDKEALRRRHLPGMQTAALSVVKARSRLIDLIKATREQFSSPKSRVLHGIKFGLKKGRGKLLTPDDEKLAEAIRKKFPELAKSLIVTTEKVDKQALGNQPADVLKKLGCTIEGTSDSPFVTIVDTDVEKALKEGMKNINE
ncbi:MAG: host-nuclease inhibitor Gam family protein [Verrucomicrobiota bacterium]